MVRRKDVVEFAETKGEDGFCGYGNCGTCKHYQHSLDCEECHSGSRYCFDWREYYDFHKEEIDDWLV